MRFLQYFVLLMVSSACALEYADDDVRIEKIPALAIQTPENITLGQTYTISFKYPLYNGCYTFENVEYIVLNDSVRVITPYARVSGQVCTEMYGEGNYQFEFYPQQSRNYYLRFYVGQDIYGVEQFEQHIIHYN